MAIDSTIQPLAFIPIPEYRQRRKATIEKLYQIAMKAENTNDRTAFCIRDVVAGDDSSDAALGNGFIDLGVKTEAVDDAQFWREDAADLTADDYSAILTANYEVDDHTWMAFLGVYDASPESADLTRVTTGELNPTGPFYGVRFKTGAKTKATYNCEGLYAQEDPVGIFNEPIIYSQNEKINIEMLFSEDSLDKDIGFIALLIEKWDRIAPTKQYQTTGTADMTAEPIALLTTQEIRAAQEKTKALLIQAATLAYGNSSDDWVVREVVIGDKDAATDFCDLDVKTVAVAGMEEFRQDSGDLTAYNLSSVLVAGEQVDRKQFVGFYGVIDDPSANLDAVAFVRGGNRIGYWHTQLAHAFQNHHPMLIAHEPVIFKENDSIDVQMMFRPYASTTMCDHSAKLLGYVVEAVGEQVSY